MTSAPASPPNRKLLDDPFIHFLIIGSVLFFVIRFINPVEEQQIVVDRQALLSFIQYRSNAFEARTAAAVLDNMTDTELQQLTENYVREEALYREADSLGLAAGDYMIRQRMVQKLEFIANALSTTALPTDTAIADYYEQNKQHYYQAPGITFSHIFITVDGPSPPENAARRAHRILDKLRREDARAEDATRYGDRFLFHTNYVERTFDYIESHFGDKAAHTLFSDGVPLATWSEPLFSKYGAHLVYVVSRSPGRVPTLDEIRTVLVEDMARAARRDYTDQFIDTVVAKYAPVLKQGRNPIPVATNPEQ